jgi:tRNA(His) guanylyltransferase
VVHVDGRSFTRLTGARFEKPFDPRLHELMIGAATTGTTIATRVV